MFQTVFHQWAFYHGWKTGMVMRAALVNIMFVKSLHVRMDTLSDRNSGSLVNMMSTDVERYVPSCCCVDGAVV